jgi:hypothetical protein
MLLARVSSETFAINRNPSATLADLKVLSGSACPVNDATSVSSRMSSA